MSSPILGNRSRAAIKERLDELEKQFLNLRSGLLEDLKVEIRGGGRGEEQYEGTSKIELYDTMALVEEQRRTEKLKEDLRKIIDDEVAETFTRLKGHFQKKRDLLGIFPKCRPPTPPLLGTPHFKNQKKGEFLKN